MSKVENTKANPSQMSIFLRKLRANRLYRLIKAVLYILIVSAVLLLIFSLNIFFIENIEVLPLADVDLTNIDPEDIEDALVGIIGKRIFTINTYELEEDLLSEFPFIREVYVTKRVPDSIIVRLSEKEPSLVIDVSTSANPDTLFNRITSVSDPKDMILDDDGYVLDTCESSKELCADLPRCAINNTWGEQPPGSKIYFSELSGIVSLDSLFNEGKYDIAGYVVPIDDTVVVQFSDSRRVIFTLTEPIKNQFDTFEYTVENLSVEGKTFKELDLRYDKPVLRVDKYTAWVPE